MDVLPAERRIALHRRVEGRDEHGVGIARLQERRVVGDGAKELVPLVDWDLGELGRVGGQARDLLVRVLAGCCRYRRRSRALWVEHLDRLALALDVGGGRGWPFRLVDNLLGRGVLADVLWASVRSEQR